MKIHQLSLFLENQPGQLLEACRILSSAKINLRALSVADAQQYGILRLIVSDWEAGAKALTEAGHVVNTTEVAAVEIPDKPGGLTEFLALLDGSGVNIEYMYTFTFNKGDNAVMICRFDDIDKAIDLLQRSPINLLDPVDVYREVK